MRFSTIASILVPALSVLAQTSGDNDFSWTIDLITGLANLPTCAGNCISATLPQSECNSMDLECLCNDKLYGKSSEGCVVADCTVKEALIAQAWQQKACKAPRHNAGPMLRRVTTSLLGAGAVCVAIRFLARSQIQDSSIGWDDWTILAAWFLLIPSLALSYVMTYKGMGRDIWTVPFVNISLILKYFYFEQYCYQMVIVLTKVSIVLLYLRIFPKEVSQRFTRICYGVIVALVIYGACFIISFGVACRPVSLYWTQWDGEHEGKCALPQTSVYTNSGFNITFGLVVFFLPIPKLLSLTAYDTRRKAAVMVIFMIGLFVTACSVVRLQYVSLLGKYTNATYHYNSISLWSGLEGEVGVICACLPTIVGPILYFFREYVGSRIATYTRSMSRGRSSCVTGDSVARLPSSASERDIEAGGRDTKLGGIERTTVTSMYNMPYPGSGDGVELIEQYPRRDGRVRHPWEGSGLGFPKGKR